MSELGRPTFQRLGLSDFCKFIALEDLEALTSNVELLQGHVQSSVIDTLAVRLPNASDTEPD
jgi:hypothetical protein